MMLNVVLVTWRSAAPCVEVISGLREDRETERRIPVQFRSLLGLRASVLSFLNDVLVNGYAQVTAISLRVC